MGCLDEGRSADAGEPRRRAPEFTLPTLDGTEIRLSSLRGRIVIIDFWATWCPPCEVQMPILDALWADERERREGSEPGLVVIGVSVDTLPANEVEIWVEERGFAYPIALGDQSLARAFGAIGFPTLVVVDPDGRIHTRHVGVLSRAELDEIVVGIRRDARASAPSES
jgi:peroxiredoxin